MAEGQKNTSNPLASAALVAGMIAGVYAMVRPMHQRIDDLEQRIQQITVISRENEACHQRFIAAIARLDEWRRLREGGS
jgi:uncharacterized protein YigA (DUF484 family)